MTRRRFAALAAGLGMATSLAVAGPLVAAKGGGGKASAKPASKALFHAVLNGRNEVDQAGKKNAGDKDAQGAAVVTVKGTTVCFGVVAQSLGSVAAAHIHAGKKGVNGGVVFDLTPTAGPGDTFAFSACKPAGTLDVAALKRNPERFYVNIHTDEFGGGAIRGQLRRLSVNQG